jgi:CRISPR-associated endonuclease/helicase Cas3
MTARLTHLGGRLLAEYLQSLTALATVFNKKFNLICKTKRWVYRAGVRHDLSKYRTGFQRYLRPLESNSWCGHVH